MARRGPKKRKKDKVLGVLVAVRFTPPQHKKVKATADRAGIPLSEWMRNLVLREAEK